MTTETTEVPKVVEIDCSTGIETVRDMTEEEIAIQEEMLVEFETRQAEEAAEAEAKAEAKASAISKLEALGLTEDEINALVK
jgi:hypothetical protein